MKRCILFLLVMLPLIAVAQDEVEKKNLKVEWAASVAIDITIPNDGTRDMNYMPIFNLGYAVGGHARLQWKKGWMIEPGVKIGYGHTRLRPAEKGDPRILLDRWRLSVPLLAGYRFETSPRKALVPMTGVEYTYYFSTGTAGQITTPRYSSADLWRPSMLAWVGGLGFQIGSVEADLLVHVNLMRANKIPLHITHIRNYHPFTISVAGKWFF